MVMVYPAIKTQRSPLLSVCMYTYIERACAGVFFNALPPIVVSVVGKFGCNDVV